MTYKNTYWMHGELHSPTAQALGYKVADHGINEAGILYEAFQLTQEEADAFVTLFDPPIEIYQFGPPKN